MTSDWSGWSAFILALCGLIGAVSAVFLNRRGQTQQAIQQEAANDLTERAQGFDEMKAIVAELPAEIVRISDSRDREFASQARRCHAVLDSFVVAFTALQEQVVAETSRRAAVLALKDVADHNAEDHRGPA